MGKISSYDSVTTQSTNDLLICDQDVGGTLTTKKTTVEQIGTAIGTLQNFADLDTSNKNLVDAINEIASYTPVYGNTASGAIATFDTSLALPLQDCTIGINAVQESGTPSPSDAKLISGFTGANIYRGSDNLYDASTITQGKYINGSGGISNSSASNITDYIECSGSITIGCRYTSLQSSNARNIACYDNTKTYLSVVSIDYTTKINTITLPNNTAYIIVTLDKNLTDIFIGTSTTTAISWQDEAGTVYGGSLDVTSGVLTVTWTKELMSTWTWSYNDTEFSYGYFNTPNITDKAYTTNVISDCFTNDGKARGSLNNNELGFYNLTNALRRLCVRCDSITDLTSWNTFIADKYIAYELATPVTYQLTPTQISAIVSGGAKTTNNVFTDTNGNTSVVYACSLKDYIDSQ